MDGRCAGGSGHGVSAYGARDPFGDRGGGSQIRTGGHHAWRRTNPGFPDHYGAHDGARLGGRGGFGLRQSDGRIWGNNHFCGKYTGPDANAAIGDLRFFTGARGDASAVRLLVLSVFISVLALALSEWMARRVVHGTGQ